MAEACEESPQAPCFNDFFIRRFKPSLRPLANVDIVSPVDGCVSELGQIDQGQILQAKGRYYTVNQLLTARDDICQQFTHGHFGDTVFITQRLSYSHAIKCYFTQYDSCARQIIFCTTSNGSGGATIILS